MIGLKENELLLIPKLRQEQRTDIFETVLAQPMLGQILIERLIAHAGSRHVQLIMPGSETEALPANTPKPNRRGNLQQWLIIRNGRIAADLEIPKLQKKAVKCGAKIVTFEISRELAANSERASMTSDGRVAGIRRIYEDSIEPGTLPADWPAITFLRNDICMLGVKLNWSELVSAAGQDQIRCFKIGGRELDLNSPDELLSFLLSHKLRFSETTENELYGCISGNVLLGREIEVQPDAVLIGPSICCSKAVIGRGAVISKSIIGPGQVVKAGEIIQNQFVLANLPRQSAHKTITVRKQNFRIWPVWSYPRTFKRLSDIIISALVLIMFLPVIIIVAGLVKLTSRGPAFFGDRRQGLYGPDFKCWKFRSMITGADRLQQKLRKLNEVDGPQFKMEDDPRVTAIGKFMRATYIDELPQFWNVLAGQMSIVGPRPSPEAENAFCAYWRDARLSVRPGITGLWQVCRTRNAGADFQEWVHYDKMYVSNVSFKLDLWICWRTALYILKAFLKQF